MILIYDDGAMTLKKFLEVFGGVYKYDGHDYFFLIGDKFYHPDAKNNVDVPMQWFEFGPANELIVYSGDVYDEFPAALQRLIKQIKDRNEQEKEKREHEGLDGLMIKENTATMRLYTTDMPAKWRPMDWERVYGPKNAINRRWIPQSVFEQIWILYEFRSHEDRLKFINKWRPPFFSEMEMTDDEFKKYARYATRK